MIMSSASSIIAEDAPKESSCASQPGIPKRKLRGDLARLVSKFEGQHPSSKDDDSSCSSKQSWASCVSSNNIRRSGTIADQDKATDLSVGALPSKTSSGRQHSHEHTDLGHGRDCMLSNTESHIITPTRALIYRQKSVAERRKAFENKADMSVCKSCC